MALLEIKKYGDKILETPTQDVDVIDKDIKKIISDMVETMYAASGLGLAANQVGFSLSIAVIDLYEDGKKDDVLILINPKIVYEEGKTKEEEGCLSFPKIYAVVERPTNLIVEAKNLEGEMFKLEAKDLLARVISHECDHLNGILFIDRLNPITKRMIKKEISKKINKGEW
jgi:peptide deformylase